MNNSCRIALIQMACDIEPAKNLEKAKQKIRIAVDKKAQIICLQELFKTPYFCTEENQKYFDLAENIPGETTVFMQSLAKELNVVLIVPLFEKKMSGIYYNSAAVIDADGSLLGVYRKMHIPDDPLYYEKYYFTQGDNNNAANGYKVFHTAYGRIGVLICWDQWYPEPARITSLLGAEIIFYPTAIGWHPAEKEDLGAVQLNAWQGVQRGHAIANGVYVASVNRVGHELTPGTDGIEFFGNSFVSDCFGQIIAQADSKSEEVLVCDIDFKLIEETRRAWPFLRDRRIDSYPPILSRCLLEADNEEN